MTNVPRVTNASEVAKWEAYAARLLEQGKESTREYAEVVKRLQHARLALAGEERYLRQRKEDGDREWARLLAIVEEGRHPPEAELARAIFEYGIEPVSPAAEYIARCTVGDIKRPLEHKPARKKGAPPKPIPDEFTLRLLYRMDLEALQVLRASDRDAYEKQHGKDAPNKVAVDRLAAQLGVRRRVIERVTKT